MRAHATGRVKFHDFALTHKKEVRVGMYYSIIRIITDHQIIIIEGRIICQTWSESDILGRICCYTKQSCLAKIFRWITHR